jgi:hypothetical protein
MRQEMLTANDLLQQSSSLESPRAERYGVPARQRVIAQLVATVRGGSRLDLAPVSAFAGAIAHHPALAHYSLEAMALKVKNLASEMRQRVARSSAA